MTANTNIKKLIKVGYALCMIFLVSCASTIPKGDYYKINKIQSVSGYVVLNIYNPYTGNETSARGNKLDKDPIFRNDIYDPTIFIDDQEIATLPYQTYTSILVRPGAHIGGLLYKETEQVMFTKPKPKHIVPFYLNLEQQHYLQFRRELEETSVISYNPTLGSSVSLVTIPTDSKFNVFDKLGDARGIIQCRFVVPKTTKL